MRVHASAIACHSLTGLHIQIPGIDRSLFKYFQGYVCILRDIDAYSATLTSVLLGGKEEISPALLEIECPDFGKRDLDYVDLWVKFSIQNGNV